MTGVLLTAALHTRLCCCSPTRPARVSAGALMDTGTAVVWGGGSLSSSCANQVSQRALVCALSTISCVTCCPFFDTKLCRLVTCRECCAPHCKAAAVCCVATWQHNILARDC